MTSLIRSLTLRNFKGFSEEVRVELRPITLLFGANSAGKSSVLHALQYVREVLDRQNVNADRTLQGGEAVDLGGFLNLVNGRDPQKMVEVAVEMELGATSIPELVAEPASYAWLYRNDSDWLNQRIGDMAKAIRHPQPRVDWDTRDRQLADQIRETALHLIEVERARRIKLHQLYQRIPELKAKLNKLDRLPLTRTAIFDVIGRGSDL